MSKEYDKKALIQELKEAAKRVKNLKEERRKRRPIIIEFSGSPKSGKTSCINSLKQFLKRNGFEVEVIQERASVCPVCDKHSPMFNIWTTCMTISGMIGVLESKNTNYDVLILDRGIFDAFCWFEWLQTQEKMERNMREAVENFLQIKDIIGCIDIVFVLTATPEKSIEREYANLLTDEMGSIMNEKVLEEYLEAVNKTIANKGSLFHNVERIDTSESDQNNVGKLVTSSTLDILNSLFIEKVGFIRASSATREIIAKNKITHYDEINENFIIEFDSRDSVEQNYDCLQPLPIAVITNKERDRVLVVKKNAKFLSSLSPERDRTLIYVGGHTRLEDLTCGAEPDFLSICKAALHREIKEEIGISISLDNKVPFYIYTQDRPKSKIHLAVCFLIEIDIEIIKLRLDSSELIPKKGTSKSGKFITLNEVSRDDSLETWSREILKECFDIQAEDPQISIDDLD